MTRTVDVVIRNEISQLETVRDALDRLGDELRIPAWPLIQLQVALDEIVSNVIRYSWPDGTEGEVLVRIAVHPGCVTLEIFDDGVPFDPRDAPDPEPSDQRRSPGGIGIHMVRLLVDEFVWRRVDGRNHTTLTKKCTVGARTGVIDGEQ
jgi:serine/threonine-protein kinase RsbW